jgi:hypothetical protein
MYRPKRASAFLPPFPNMPLRNKALKPDCVTDYYNFFCNGYYTNFVSLKQSLPLFLNLSETFTAREMEELGGVLQRLGIQYLSL